MIYLMVTLLDTWPIIFMFLGSKVSIKGLWVQIHNNNAIETYLWQYIKLSIAHNIRHIILYM